MAKIKQKRKSKNNENYFLKLVIFLILGFCWIKIDYNSRQIPIPLGLMIGLLLVSKDKLKIDKKIEYAVLLMAMLIGFWAPTGLYLSL